ncbi:hypothetical protein D3C86_1925260 [compost metagenome]
MGHTWNRLPLLVGQRREQCSGGHNQHPLQLAFFHPLEDMTVGYRCRAATAAAPGNYIFLFVQIIDQQAAVIKFRLFHGNAFLSQ